MNMDDASVEHATMIEDSNPRSTSSNLILNEASNPRSTFSNPTLNEASNPTASSNTLVNEASILITMDMNLGMSSEPPLNHMRNVNIQSNLDMPFNPSFDNVDDIYSNHEENETVNDTKKL